MRAPVLAILALLAVLASCQGQPLTQRYSKKQAEPSDEERSDEVTSEEDIYEDETYDEATSNQETSNEDKPNEDTSNEKTRRDKKKFPQAPSDEEPFPDEYSDDDEDKNDVLEDGQFAQELFAQKQPCPCWKPYHVTDTSNCTQPTNCKRGRVMDMCGCCVTCAKGRGEPCGGLYGSQGRCAAGLLCTDQIDNILSPTSWGKGGH